MKYAGIGPISVHFPEKVETNELLQKENPSWRMNVIASKTGINKRHVAAPNECSSDLGVAAAEKLFRDFEVDPQSIDFLLFCTQTPDYALPTTACLIQDRLGLKTGIGAMDFNLGCSGFVYGLSLADGLIRSGSCKKILFVTGETYTKLIHSTDRSLRTIFGDAGTATVIEATDEQSIWACQYGTDGSGANTLIAPGTGFRCEDEGVEPRHRRRWPSQLYMDGPGLINFTVGSIPDLVTDILKQAEMSTDDVGYYLFHQATRKMLEQLMIALEIEDEAKLPIRIEDIGNTVSCTLPILINQMRDTGELTPDLKNLLIGFGVGWSWAGCVWQDVLGPNFARS